MENTKKSINDNALQGFVDKKFSQPPILPSTENKIQNLDLLTFSVTPSHIDPS